MSAIFRGDHPALDFINTSYGVGEPTEVIPNGHAFMQWLVDAGLVDKARAFDRQALDAAAADARKLRTWATSWVERWHAHPKGDYEAEVRRLNRLLLKLQHIEQLHAAADGFRIIQNASTDTPDALVALLASKLADLFANASPALVKRCGGPDCTLWFLDTTKAHRRIFCSATACGNRAKVAAFRERQRST